MTAIGGFDSMTSMGVLQQRAASIARYADGGASGVSSPSAGTKATGAYQSDVELQTVSWDEIRDGLKEAEANAAATIVDELDSYMRDSAEAKVAGRTQAEYQSFRSRLDDAVNDGNYRKARELVGDFYSGGTATFRRELENIMEEADNAFAAGVRNAFSGYKLESEARGQATGDHDRLSFIVASALDAAKARNPSPASMEDWEQSIATMRTESIQHGLGKLHDAGRNLYTENAQSVLAATADRFRDNLAGSKSTLNELDRQSESGRDVSYGSEVGGLGERYGQLRSEFLRELHGRLGGRNIVEVVDPNEPAQEAQQPQPESLQLQAEQMTILQQTKAVSDKWTEEAMDGDSKGDRKAYEAYSANAEQEGDFTTGQALNIAV